MSVSVYDKALLSEPQQRRVEELQTEWQRASAAGDKNAMDAAHSAAEEIRRQSANYSGGADGAGYVKLPAEREYSAMTIQSYRPQTESVERIYNAARETELAGLKSAYDKNVAALKAEREAIPETYDAARRRLSAGSETARQSFNEYAAARGLASGASGQAELSRRNTLLSGLAELGRAEAGAIADTKKRLSELDAGYANDVAAAKSRNEYERAGALLEEARAAERSGVEASSKQADENYRAYKAANDGRAADWARLTARAEALSSFGDFSGYAALGFTDGEIAGMRRAWIAKNPKVARRMGLR